MIFFNSTPNPPTPQEMQSIKNPIVEGTIYNKKKTFKRQTILFKRDTATNLII